MLGRKRNEDFFSNNFLNFFFNIQNVISTTTFPLIDVYCRMLPMLCAKHLEFVPNMNQSKKNIFYPQ